ncbi:MAG: preprotein translocase subunit SecG [Gemmatimonadaceae bacterium]
MYTFLLILLILDSIVLVTAILLQAGKGGGLAASFGGVTTAADAFIGSRQAGNLLTKTSWWCSGIFLGLAFVLQLLSARTTVPRSILDQLPGPASAPTAPQGGAAPAVPLTTPNQQAAPAKDAGSKGPAETPKQ